MYPASLLYAAGVGFRNLMYDSNVFKSKTFDNVKTISVGNLCAGGSGKTPHVEYLIHLLKSEFKIATLSRGYKRKTSGYVLSDASSTASDIGDEPLQFKYKNPDIHVAVDGNRVRGINNLTALEDKPDVILLDDAFQHRKVKAGLSIVLTDFANLYYNDMFLPSGSLRESKKGISRADIIVVTKTPDYATMIELRTIIKDINPRAYQNLFFSYLKYSNLYKFNNPKQTLRPAMDIFRHSVLIVTGIANPAPMVTYVKEYAESIVHKAWPDHHNFTLSDVEEIKNIFTNIANENKLIVTTEKDAMRFKRPEFDGVLNDLPIYILPVEVDFKNKTEEFNQTIFKYVRTNRIYHKKYM